MALSDNTNDPITIELTDQQVHLVCSALRQYAFSFDQIEEQRAASSEVASMMRRLSDHLEDRDT